MAAPTLAMPGKIEGRLIGRKASEVKQEYPGPSTTFFHFIYALCGREIFGIFYENELCVQPTYV